MTIRQIIKSSAPAFWLWWGYYSRARVLERAAETSEAKTVRRRGKPGKK